MPKRRSQPQTIPAPALASPDDPFYGAQDLEEEEIEQLRRVMAEVDPQALASAMEATATALDTETETITVSRKDWYMYLRGAENMRRAAFESMYAPQPPAPVPDQATKGAIPRPSGDWLTVKEAANKADVHPKTIRRWQHAGALKAQRHPGFGNCWWYSQHSLLLLIQPRPPESNV